MTMTTNQTINDVPRDLLENIVIGLEKKGFGINWATELRALLDAPVHPCPVQLDGCDGSCVPAAQPRALVPLKLLIDLGKPLIEDADLHTRIMARNELRDLLGGECAWVASAPSVPCEQYIRSISGIEQPAPVAVVMSFDFEHPSSKERRTVALSKQDVFDGMEDYFYDKLGEQICRCESVGETNVVDCSCDEYVHDFEIVKASLTS